MLRPKIEMMNERESYGDGSKWYRGPLIGKGNSCSVFLAHLKPDLVDNPLNLRQKMAVKSSKEPKSSLGVEGYFLEILEGSPYIVQCFGHEMTIGKNGEEAFNLLLEYGDGGSLAEKIRRSRGEGLEEEEVRIFAKCIAKGLCHIHEKGYMHRDLRPDNIILVATCKPFDEAPKNCTNKNAGKGTTLMENKTNTTKNSYIAKICDFGCAKDFTKLRLMKVEPYLRGNIRYLSPEAAVTKKQGPEGDIWALGCVVFEMLTGETVWRRTSGLKIEKVLLEMGNGVKHYGIMPGKISDAAISFMEACLVIDPKFRWSARMLLDHPFIKGV